MIEQDSESTLLSLRDGWLRRSSRWSKIAALLLALIFCVALYAVAATWRLNAWLSDDATLMVHYPDAFVVAGELTPSADPRSAALEEAIFRNQIATGRKVVKMSRSKSYVEPWRRFRYVKIFMETELPGSERFTVEVKFAVRYSRAAGGDIVIRGTDTLGL